MKIDIGCGKNKRDGFVGVDNDPNCGADVVASALDLPFEDDSAEEVHSSHLVEHFTPEEAKIFFDEIYRVLKIGGTADIKIDRDWSKKKLFKKDSTHKYRFSSKEIKLMLDKFNEAKVENKIYFFKIYQPRSKIFVWLKK